jgi:hypothetical protein
LAGTGRSETAFSEVVWLCIASVFGSGKKSRKALFMTGIHHVTAISGKAAHNLGFYTQVLGLRFVKKTVNFDDPATYHLYYGDSEGHPGTILTFFPWERAAPGRAGVGFTQETEFDRLLDTSLC